MKPLNLFLTVTTVFIASYLQPALSEAGVKAIEQPVDLLERTSQEVIKILRNDRELLKSEPARIYKIVDDYILPHLDDVTMAKLALGKNWKKATNEQKLTFVEEFRNLLVRTYSKSLIEFKDQEIRFFPLELAEDTHKIFSESRSNSTRWAIDSIGLSYAY